MSGLLSLNLNSCALGNAGAVALADMLRSNDAMQELAIEHNAVQDEGLRAILEVRARGRAWRSLRPHPSPQALAGRHIRREHQFAASAPPS